MTVVRFLAERVSRTLLVMVGLVTATFFITRVGTDPAKLMLPISATDNEVAAFRHQLGLDRPVIDQYIDYIGHAVRGDFGESLWQREPAMEVVARALPASMYLAGASMLLAVLIGLPLGIVAGGRPGSIADRITGFTSTIALSTPDFWLGLVLVFAFAVQLGWFPTSGYGGVSYVILPAVTLALRPAGRLAQVTREAVVSEMSKRYVLAARAKGLSQRKVLSRHVLKNVLGGSVTMIGYDFVFLFTGYAMTVETIFAWPGLGRLAVQATLQQDLTLVAAAVIVAGFIIAVVNLALDFVTSALDPRLIS